MVFHLETLGCPDPFPPHGAPRPLSPPTRGASGAGEVVHPGGSRHPGGDRRDVSLPRRQDPLAGPPPLRPWHFCSNPGEGPSGWGFSPGDPTPGALLVTFGPIRKPAGILHRGVLPSRRSGTWRWCMGPLLRGSSVVDAGKLERGGRPVGARAPWTPPSACQWDADCLDGIPEEEVPVSRPPGEPPHRPTSRMKRLHPSPRIPGRAAISRIESPTRIRGGHPQASSEGRVRPA